MFQMNPHTLVTRKGELRDSAQHCIHFDKLNFLEHISKL